MADLARSDPPVAAVKAWLVEGHSLDVVAGLISEQFADLQPEELLAAVGQELIADADTNSQALRGWAMNAYREIYKRALAANDFGPALRAVKELLNLAPPT